VAWDLNGSDQYARFSMNAALEAAPGGPMTMLGLIHLDSISDGAVLHLLSSGASPRTFMEIFATWNYGTSAGARTGPAGTTGAWYLVIISKNTGAVAPEYTLMTLSGGTFGTPVSGTLTGGGVSLADGTAPGAGGIIQMGRWGTAGSEYIDGRVAAAAIWTAYKNQAAREALVTWALVLASSGIQWAARFDTLSTITDATSNGGNETGRFGTTPFILAADPTSDFFGGSSLSGAVALTSGATLTAAGTRDQPATAALSSGSTLTAAAVRTQFAAAALSSGSNLTTAATRVQPGAAALSSGSNLTAAATRVQSATTALSSGSVLTTAGTREQLPTLTLVATPALTVTAIRIQQAAAALSAAPALSITAQGSQLGAVALSAAPVLSASGAGPASLYVTAVLTAGAVAAAALTPGARADATLTSGASAPATLIASTL
jgi:hypothetical protein